MFSGGDYEEVARWLRNFVASHAKRENLRVEPEVDTEGPREGQSYGVRLRLGRRVMPPPSEPPPWFFRRSWCPCTPDSVCPKASNKRPQRPDGAGRELRRHDPEEAIQDDSRCIGVEPERPRGHGSPRAIHLLHDPGQPGDPTALHGDAALQDQPLKG